MNSTLFTVDTFIHKHKSEGKQRSDVSFCGKMITSTIQNLFTEIEVAYIKVINNYYTSENIQKFKLSSYSKKWLS